MTDGKAVANATVRSESSAHPHQAIVLNGLRACRWVR